jgi:predicted metal-dependent hydrolase
MMEIDKTALSIAELLGIRTDFKIENISSFLVSGAIARVYLENPPRIVFGKCFHLLSDEKKKIVIIHELLHLKYKGGHKGEWKLKAKEYGVQRCDVSYAEYVALKNEWKKRKGG